jgi:hypothetical protein
VLGNISVFLNSTVSEIRKSSDPCGYEYVLVTFAVIIGAHLISLLRKQLLLNVPAYFIGTRGGALVEALRYKPEFRGFDSGWYH